MNKEEFFISVIIPVYNGEKFIERAILNVEQQNYEPIELIVVDDGSTDGTHNFLSQFKDKIHYIYQPNRGSAAARNTGIKNASGNILAFLDVDDRWSENKLNLLIGHLKENQSAQIVQGLVQEMCLIDSEDDEEMRFKISSPPYQFINI